MKKRKTKRNTKRNNIKDMFMEEYSGKHFTITEPFGENTVVYEIYKTHKEYLHIYPEYTVERLEFTECIGNNECRKTFYIEDPVENGNQLLIFTFYENKNVVQMNNGLLIGDEVRISKKPTHMHFERCSPENSADTVEITGNAILRKGIPVVIDPLTTQEIRPELSYDEGTGQILYKYKLMPYQNYFMFELHSDKSKS